MNTNKHTLWLCMLIAYSAASQNDYSIHFQVGQVRPQAFIKPQEVNNEMLASARFQQKHYLLLQFKEIPDADAMAALSTMGVELLHYVPHYAYFAALPASINPGDIPGLRAVLFPERIWKLSPELITSDTPTRAIQDEFIRIQVLPYGNIAPATLADSLVALGYTSTVARHNRLEICISPDQVMALAAHPGILYLAPAEIPSFTEGISGHTSVRSNFNLVRPQWGWNGKGVSVSLADDGSVSHLDFKNRLTLHTSLNAGTHGDMTAGILTGAGNIHPLAVGAAPGLHLHLYHINDYPHIAQAVSNYLAHRSVITSTSYGDGCGGIYSIMASELDAQVVQRRELLHVFSAGNNGQQTCSTFGQLGYYLGYRFGNITGGRKAAKHALVVGNLFYNDSLRINSSRGPLNDGTLKPDLTALGQGNLTTGPDNTYQIGSGTSAAAPLVAGIAAQLYQAYRHYHQNNDPTFAHIKAALLNTADDLGRPGPDYEFGWGRPNAVKAMKVVESNWFVSGTVGHQAQNTHIIPVPANTKQLRVMVYWFDPAAIPNAGQTLINDLDLSVIAPNNAVIHPWVLSKAAHIDSITKPAWRGIDRTNVVEQVTIDNPTAGAYRIQIRGHMVPQGPQDYLVAWYFEDQPLKLTYPNGEASFVPHEVETIRWDAIGSEGFFQLEYSTDSMATWQTIAADIPGQKRHYDFTVPDIVTGRAFFRISRNGMADTCTKPVSIIGLPDFQLHNAGEHQARISWLRVAGANTYTVYAAGEQYMEPIGVTSDTFLLFAVQPNTSNWYSVSAGHTSGITGRRAYARYYMHFPCQSGLALTIKLDQFPSETRWEIRNNAGVILLSGGPYAGFTPYSTVQETFCLPYGCFEFVIYDGYNDGLCCQHGQGYYQLRNATGQILVSGAQFAGQENRPFCLNSTGQPLIVSALVLQPVSCFGGNNGRAIVQATQGTGTYYYTWSNGATTQTVSNLVAGTYTVTVSDGLSQAVATVTVPQPPALSLVLEALPVRCAGGSDGSAWVETSGGTAPWAFLWSNGQTDSIVNGLSAGVWTVTVTDGRGCRQTGAITVPQPPELSLTAIVTPSTNGTNGAIQLNLSGGVWPYSTLWNTGATSSAVQGLAAGTYNVTVTDANACTRQQSIIVPSGAAAYCAAIGNNTGFEWIQRVQIGSFVHQSGNNGGYGNFTAMHITASPSMNIELQPAYANVQYLEYWTVWIDLNRDGLLEDPAERVFSASGVGLMQGIIQLPSGYGPGPTLLRVAMRYGASALPCGNFPYGEVEDYTIVLPPASGGGMTYCASGGSSTANKWIQRVQLGTLVNDSGPNGGYANFTALYASVPSGAPMEIVLTPGHFDTPGGEHWRVWMDYNRDGDFLDPGEQVLYSNLSNQLIHATIYLAANLSPGPIRVRIAMRWNNWPEPCDTFPWGEVEDYTLHITSSAQQDSPEMVEAPPSSMALHKPLGARLHPEMVIFPNPAKGSATLQLYAENEEPVELIIQSADGQVWHRQTSQVAPGNNLIDLQVQGLPGGVFWVTVKKPGVWPPAKLVILAGG